MNDSVQIINQSFDLFLIERFCTRADLQNLSLCVFLMYEQESTIIKHKLCQHFTAPAKCTGEWKVLPVIPLPVAASSTGFFRGRAGLAKDPLDPNLVQLLLMGLILDSLCASLKLMQQKLAAALPPSTFCTGQHKCRAMDVVVATPPHSASLLPARS